MTVDSLQPFQTVEIPTTAQFFKTTIPVPNSHKNRLTHHILDGLAGMTTLSMSVYWPVDEAGAPRGVTASLFGSFSTEITPGLDDRKGQLCQTLVSWSYRRDRDHRPVSVSPDRWSLASIPWSTGSGRNFAFPILVLKVEWNLGDDLPDGFASEGSIPDLDIYITAMP